MSEDELLAPFSTAKLLNVAVGTLAVWRCTGRYDLPFYKVGKSVRYRRADVIFASASSTFGHPEQTLGIVTLLGGIYRVAERAGRARAAEWALTSERVSASAMERFGIVNRVMDDADLIKEATAFAEKLARGPTRAYAAHKDIARLKLAGLEVFA
jgi:1,4-dihydroxy-2-naphthoyl-CoA synthase